MKITSAHIEYINFDSDEIIAHGLKIFNCLQSNQTLEDLDIDVYDFVPLPVDSRRPLSLNKDEFGLALGDMLYSNMSLRKLRLSGCGEVGSEIGAEIARGLCNSATLEELNLGGNDLLAEGLRKLAVAFTPNVAGNKSNTSVSSLRLSSSVRGSEAVEVLANTLQLNTYLTSLDFSWDNALSPHNVNVLLSALKTNVGIKYLNLERCSGVPGDAVFTALVDLKDTNPRVEEVRLVDTSLYTNRGYNMLVKTDSRKVERTNHAPGPEDIFDPSVLDFSESIHPSAEGIIRLQSSSMKDEGTSTDIFDVCANPTFHTARHFVYILECDMYHLDTSWKELQNFVMFFIG
ncbi:unnamed protein product [Sphagnum tenellum]